MLRPVSIEAKSSDTHDGRVTRQRWGSSWLALRLRGARETVILADDVPDGDVAAVVRHVLTEHADSAVGACRLPACSAVLIWRPAPVVTARHASAV